MSLAAVTRDRIQQGFLRPGLRRAVDNYCQLLAGTFSRVGPQAVQLVLYRLSAGALYPFVTQEARA